MEPVDNKSFSQGAAGDRVADKSSGSVGVVGAQAGATVGRVSDGVFRQESQSAPRSVQGFESAPQPVQGLGPTPQPVQGLGSALREKPQSVSAPVQNPGFASLGSAQPISQPEQSSEPTPQEDSSQVSHQEQKPGHMTDEEFYASFSNPMIPVNSAEGDIILNNGVKRRKKGLIIGAIVASVGLVIGLMVFIFVVLPAMDPKTGEGIKAKNYQEAFNIYANYFLFGVRSKEAVDWDATKAEDFESYFVKAVDNPSKVEAIMSGQKTTGGIVNELDGYFELFQELYLAQDKKDEYFTGFVNEYNTKMKFMDKYYNVGLPVRTVVLDKYEESGYDAAEELISQMAEEYRDVGVIYDVDVSDAVSGFGDSQLAIIEIYKQAGCLVEWQIDPDCMERSVNEEMDYYLKKSMEQIGQIRSVEYNSIVVLSNDVFEMKYGLDALQADNKDERKGF